MLAQQIVTTEQVVKVSELHVSFSINHGMLANMLEVTDVFNIFSCTYQILGNLSNTIGQNSGFIYVSITSIQFFPQYRKMHVHVHSLHSQDATHPVSKEYPPIHTHPTHTQIPK